MTQNNINLSVWGAAGFAGMGLMIALFVWVEARFDPETLMSYTATHDATTFWVLAGAWLAVGAATGVGLGRDFGHRLDAIKAQHPDISSKRLARIRPRERRVFLAERAFIGLATLPVGIYAFDRCVPDTVGDLVLIIIIEALAIAVYHVKHREPVIRTVFRFRKYK